VLIITDRDELDKQIERVFTDAGETIYRCQQRPRPDGAAGQAQAAPAVLAGAQVRPADVDDFEAFIKDLEAQPSPTAGRAVRVRGRVPPHPERQAAPD
jgi:type I restriction enzyme R subunit